MIGRKPGLLRTEREQRAGQAAEEIGFGACRADILIKEMEDLKEGPARGDDTQVVVEHKKRAANSIDDGVRARLRLE